MAVGTVAVGFELRAVPGAADSSDQLEAHRTALVENLRRLEELRAPDVLLEQTRRELEGAGRGDDRVAFRLAAGSPRESYAAMVLAATAYALALDVALVDPQAGAELRGDALRRALPALLTSAMGDAAPSLEPFAGWD